MSPATTSTAAPAPLTVTAAEAERLTGGTWLGDGTSVTIRGAAIDSRVVAAGQLFACLTGAHHDGHDHAAAAVAAGAVLVLASRLVNVAVPVLLVNDVAAALGQFAAEQRRRLASTTFVAVAGANGKTTTKELIAAACGRGTHATPGNRNNHLGVPLTLLATPAGTRVAVIEIGADRAGDVAALASLVRPTIGVVTSIGPEHLAGFGDLRGVCRGECELFASLPPEAPALIGLIGLAEHARLAGIAIADLHAIIASAARGRRLIAVGSAEDLAALRQSCPDAACEARPIHGETSRDDVILRTSAGTARLGLLGAHNLANAALAHAAAIAAGSDPEAALAGLARIQPVAGRLQPRRLGLHRILDDSYNANPASMRSALTTLASLSVQSGRPGLAVLGAMAELGATSAAAHRDIGAAAAALGLPVLAIAAPEISAGCRAAGGTADDAADLAAALTALTARLAAATTAATPLTVLIKASRSAGLDALVRRLGTDAESAR